MYMKTPDFILKKQLNRTIDNAIEMNNISKDFVHDLVSKYDDVFSVDEKESLNNLHHYLNDTLNLFFNKLKV